MCATDQESVSNKLSSHKKQELWKFNVGKPELLLVPFGKYVSDNIWLDGCLSNGYQLALSNWTELKRFLVYYEV